MTWTPHLTHTETHPYRSARDRHGEGRALFLLSSALWATDPEEAISLGTAAVAACETDDEALTEQAAALVATMQERVSASADQ